MKKGKSDQEIKDNIKWFKKFPLEKRLELAFEQIKAVKILRALTPKKNAASTIDDLIALKKLRSSPKDLLDIQYLQAIKNK